MGPVDYGAGAPGFPFKVGDKIMSTDWANPSPKDYITITAIGNHRFLAEWSTNGHEACWWKSGAWSPWVERREFTVVTERRQPRMGECYLTHTSRTATGFAAYDFGDLDVRDVIVGVKE